MAARRLIAVMLVLLFLSSLAAALAPVDRQDETSTSTTTEPNLKASAPDGKLVRATLDTKRKPGGVVRAAVGDQLQLKVTALHPGTVELVGLGATEDVDPLAPARFDVLLEVDAKRYRVKMLETGRTLGTIEVVDQPSSSDGVNSS